MVDGLRVDGMVRVVGTCGLYGWLDGVFRVPVERAYLFRLSALFVCLCLIPGVLLFFLFLFFSRFLFALCLPCLSLVFCCCSSPMRWHFVCFRLFSLRLSIFGLSVPQLVMTFLYISRMRSQGGRRGVLVMSLDRNNLINV